MARRHRPFFPLVSAADGFVMPSSFGNARKNVDVVHEMIGGVDRFADWADKNPGEFYTKIYTRNIERHVQNDTMITETLEAKLARLEAGDRAVDITPTSIDGVPQAPIREYTDLEPDDD